VDAEQLAGCAVGDPPRLDVVVPSLPSATQLAGPGGRSLQFRHSLQCIVETQKLTRPRQVSRTGKPKGAPSVGLTDMVKLVNLLVRQDDMSHEEFVEYWYEEHVPLAEELPHANKYATSVPTAPERSEYDGIVELYFDDMSDLQAAFESEVGQEVQADLAHFAKPDAGPTLYVDETVQMGGDA